MKFIRNSKTRERVVDIVAKSMLIAFSVLVCLWMISGARAGGAEITDIRQEALDDGSYAVDFLLSKPIAKTDVAVEFQRNFIQLTLRGVGAYPARTTKLNHAAMEKVFTYQYQPDITRARMLLKGQASTIQPLSSWEVEAQRIRILVKGGDTAAAAVAADAVKTRASSVTAASVADAALEAEEAKLRQDIASGKGALGAGTTVNAAPTAATTAAPAPTNAAKPEKPVDKESLPVFTGAGGTPATAKQASGSGSRVFTSLLLVIGLIAAGFLGFRKFAKGQGLNLNLGGLGNLGFQRQQSRMIEVVTTQSIGPKRSVAIIKVLDQYMVVGMAGDSMTLLNNLGTNVNLDKYMDETSVGGGTGPSFSSTFQGVLSGVGGQGGVSAKDPLANINPEASGTTAKTAGDVSIRSAIKKRLEGFKPL